MAPQIKILFKISACTALAMVLYEISNQLLIYKYFKFEYYLFAFVLIALVVGFVLARHYTIITDNLSSNHPLEKLTGKETEILALIADGKSNKEIAVLNFVEVSTVKTHINNIYNKLGVKSRREAIQIYQQAASVHKIHPISTLRNLIL